MTDTPIRWSRRQVAVYWDFENLVISEYDRVHDHRPPRKPGERRPSMWSLDRNLPASERDLKLAAASVNIDALLAFGAALGDVVVNRAYCDWTRPVMEVYGEALATRCVEPIQMFSKDSGKNGADIRIALDVADEVSWNPTVTDVVLFSGDGDFLPVADLCRRRGIAMHAVGVRGSTNDLWRRSCAFRYLDELSTKRTVAEVRKAATSGVDVAGLLPRALAQLPVGQWVETRHLEPLIRRVNWAVDLACSPYDSIEGLIRVAAEAGIVEQAEQVVRLIVKDIPVQQVSADVPAGAADVSPAAARPGKPRPWGIPAWTHRLTPNRTSGRRFNAPSKLPRLPFRSGGRDGR
ncbi:NYN domain-containing protein [Mycolicibacterium llatzerense]|uniref:NYN domain-containing protein n=1 Tax=Mycolicibacterium llatzerense TaxID=280871 RepID=UPI0008DC6685|nr:NYN domain-containing protein [Mycolicibacterium llatzerense]